jgi:hypothetical protein
LITVLDGSAVIHDISRKLPRKLKLPEFVQYIVVLTYLPEYVVVDAKFTIGVDGFITATGNIDPVCGTRTTNLGGETLAAFCVVA